MRILLDENLDARLKSCFPGHEVSTVKEMKWNGLKNGELLFQLAQNSFDIPVTADKNIRFQQNIGSFPVGVVLLSAFDNRLVTLRPLADEAFKRLQCVKRAEFVEISAL